MVKALSGAEDEAAVKERYRKCCAICQRAKEIAESVLGGIEKGCADLPSGTGSTAVNST
jgi:hypothetical protein